MKVVAVLALFVCVVAAMPADPEVDELARRFLFDVNALVKKIVEPLKQLVGSDASEAVCETACKTGIHTVVPIPFVDLACGPACKELQHLGQIAG